MVALPFNFVNGTVADATQVMANFNALNGAIGGGITLTPPALPSTITSNQISIAPTPIGGRPGISPIGFNIYFDSSGGARFIGNGPGAMIWMQPDAGSAGVGSRLNIVVSDNNQAGPGAVAPLEGICSFIYGPQGVTPDQAYMVVGGRSYIPANPPTFGTIIVEQIAITPSVIPARPAVTSRLGFNSYMANSGTFYYTDDGGAAAILIHSDRTPGSVVGSRMNFVIMDINSAGQSAPVSALEGILNLIYGPVGNPGDQGYVVVGGADKFPAFQPAPFSLLCEGLYIQRQQVLIGPAGSGPGGTGRALYLA